MTPEQLLALQGVVGRSLTASEIEAVTPLLAIRDDVAIAAVLSVGRVRYEPKMITERGVRAALSITASSQFIRLLKQASESGTTPAWLETTLTAIGVPSASHEDYADAIGSAYGWLRQEGGVDIASAATRGMLDLIAMSDPAKYGATVTTLKALAAHADPIEINQVSNALNIAEGAMTL